MAIRKVTLKERQEKRQANQGYNNEKNKDVVQQVKTRSEEVKQEVMNNR